MIETELSGSLRRGDDGFDVERVQEWLTLAGFGLSVDGKFGPATENAVKRYQTRVGVAADGIVAPALFGGLTAPMQAALAPISASGRTLGSLTVAYAEQHLSQRPREVGGNNRGPWVRLYMGGKQGDPWQWCAGFACFCLSQAARTLGVSIPLKPSVICDVLAHRAQSAGLFIDGADSRLRIERLRPGSMFLVRRSSEGWEHVGLVREISDEYFTSIEGNSHPDGGRGAYEVCSKSLGWADSHGLLRDFISVS